MNLFCEKSVWQLQKAKAQFSEVVNHALSGHPQLITRNGSPAVYVVSARVYEDEHAHNRRNRKDVLRDAPCRDVVLDLSRSDDCGREVEL